MISVIKKKILKILLSYGVIWGVDVVFHLRKFRDFKREFLEFKGMQSETNTRFSIEWSDRYPCLYDKSKSTPYDRHYIYHPAWAARVLAKTNPAKHIDFSSSLTFSTILSAFISVDFYDFRPAELSLSNLNSYSGDLLHLPFKDGEILSASCMHVIEHIGLGRYGDPLDQEGDLKAAQELTRVTAAGGDLLIVLPVGSPRIQFNAHRIYSYQQVIHMFSQFSVQEFVLITDDDNPVQLIVNASEDQINKQKYGCGCFWFKKNI